MVPRTQWRHIPTQRGAETCRALTTGQRSGGQRQGNFQTPPSRGLAAPRPGPISNIGVIYMHTHTHPPDHPPRALIPSLNLDFKLLAMVFSQHEAETFY